MCTAPSVLLVGIRGSCPLALSVEFAARGGVCAERGEDTLLCECKITKAMICMVLEDFRSMTMIEQKKVESREI